jgi:RNA 3'-phosphate cyclase
VRGSAGAVSLVFQALLLPLSRAAAPSQLTLIGGTHVAWSPSFHYLSDVFVPLLAEGGIRARVVLHRWGWYPRGGGEVEAAITPGPVARALVLETTPPGGSLVGLTAVSHLPRSIAERERRRVEERLATAGLAAQIALVEDATALGPGTSVFLGMPGRCGFSALGRRGLPAEAVADAAVDALLAHRASGAALDDHLADQIVPFLALGAAPSTFTCPTLSSHLRTVAWVVDAFLPGRITLEGGMPARVRVFPHGDGSSPTHGNPGVPESPEPT